MNDENSDEAMKNPIEQENLETTTNEANELQIAEKTSNVEENETENQVDDVSLRKRFFIIGVVALTILILSVGYFYLGRSNETAAETESEADTATAETVVSVKVAKAERKPIAREFTAIGTVTALKQATVAASISAQITKMPLWKNKFVQKGEVLAVLASQDLIAQRNEAQAALQEAQLNLQTLQEVTIPQTEAQIEKELSDAKAAADNARAIYLRRKELYAKGGISLKELEASELALINAENALRLAEKNAKLNRTAINPNARAIAENKIRQAQARINAIDAQLNLATIRAPISGVVIEQFQYEGEFASQGARLLTIADISTVIVKANFADTVVANLKVGDSVAVYPTDAPQERMSGKITLISRSADPQNRTVEVWAIFGNPQGLLKIGGTALFVVSSETINDAIVVPALAVTLDATTSNEGTVMIVDKDLVAHERKVKVGIRQGDEIQIIEGLSAGETVIIEGNYALPDGTKVEIAKNQENKDGENDDEKP